MATKVRNPIKRDGPFNYCDVCVGVSEDIGWLDVMANEKGREALQAIFAELPIDWKGAEKIATGMWPPDWSFASIHLPKMIEVCPTHRLAKFKGDPDKLIYGRHLAVMLHVAGCRVMIKEAEGPEGFKLLNDDALCHP
jgi:hypothetical protein